MTATNTEPSSQSTVDLVSRLAELLTHASWRLRRASRAELQPLGLTFGQARALRLLARAGGPMRIGELATQLEVVPRSATTVVDALEGAGLAARQADPADRRSVLVGLTDRGAALLERLGHVCRASAEELFGRLTADEREHLLALLVALNEPEAPSGEGEAVP